MKRHSTGRGRSFTPRTALSKATPLGATDAVSDQSTPEKQKMALLSLFHVIMPKGGEDAFLDNSDTLWEAFNQYGERNQLETVQVITVGQGLSGSRPVFREKGNTRFHFLPKKPFHVLLHLIRELRGTSIAILNNESLMDLIIGLYCKLCGSRVAIFYHNEVDPLKSKLPPRLLQFLRRNIADAFFSNSVKLKEDLKGSKRPTGTMFPHPMYLFKFGYYEALFSPAKRPHRQALQLLYVGRIAPEKRIEDVIEGISGSRNKNLVQLTVVGQDPDPQQSHLRMLQALAEGRGVNCRFVGHVPHSKLVAFYHEADIFVNMRPDEGFGKVFVEAMAAGLPVIGRAGSPGPEQLIKHRWNGFLVKNTAELASSLDEFARRRSLSSQLGRNARSFVRQEYTFDASYRSLAEGLNDLIAGYHAEHRFFSSKPFPTARRFKRLLLNQRVDTCSHVLIHGEPIQKEQAVLLPYCRGRGIDVGCGSNKTHPDAIGVDLTPSGAIGRFGNQAGQPSAAEIQASGDDLFMFRNGELDYVVARHNLEHYQDPVKTLQEWKRVVRRGGIIGIVIPDDTYCDTIHLDPTHYHVFTPGSFRTLVEFIGGLKILKLEVCIRDWSFVCIMEKTG